MPSYIPSFYFYKFASAVSAPYTNLEAYKSGAIDENGNILDSEGSIDPFEYFVIKIKKIFEQLPAGTTKYKLQNLYGTIQLFSEEVEKFKIPKDQFNFFVESQIMLNSPIESSYLMLTEDMTTSGVAGGIGTPDKTDKVNTGNVSGYDPILGFSEPRSSPVNMISSVEMFNVSPQEFKSFKNSKTWKYLPNSKTKNYLQRYQRRNKQAKMAVRDEETGEVFFIPYKEKSLIEELNLTELNILKESSIVEPEQTKTGQTSKSEVWALSHIKKLFDKNGFTHIPWGETIKDPLQYQISPGQRGREDIIASNSEGELVPVEAKSIKGGRQYRAFNLDFSKDKTPKGLATYATVAHGLADIYGPEYAEYQTKILKDSPIETVSAELERQKGIKFQTGRIPSISWKNLASQGIPRLGTSKRVRERIMDWRRDMLDLVGNEKGGTVLAVNPEERILHALNLDTGKGAGAVRRLLGDLGGLKPTGSASTSYFGTSAMHTPNPKMSKSSAEGKMLRTDYRFGLSAEKRDPWIENGRMAFDGLNVGSREDFKNWNEVMDRLIRGK